jgi:hypothetical protein
LLGVSEVIIPTSWSQLRMGKMYSNINIYPIEWQDQTQTCPVTLAGRIGLKSLQPNDAQAEAYFDRAFTVARQQQAKS